MSRVTWVSLALVTLAISPLAALDFAGLQAAVRSAPPGGLVLVPSGDYIGQLVVDRPVVLRAQPGARLVHEEGTPQPTLTISSRGTRIEGLEVIGSGTGTRRDNTAIVVTASDVVLTNVKVRGAWAGLWIDKADRVVVDGLVFRGLADYPFWERGEGVRVTNATGTRLRRLDLAHTNDAILFSSCTETTLDTASVTDARYGLHLMFGTRGQINNLTTRQTVAGVMAMETSLWSIAASSFTQGYRTGSAGIRIIRSVGLTITDSLIARQASGVELIDVRDTQFRTNSIEENATAWTWGGDNSGTTASANRHRGNLIDVSGTEPAKTLAPTDAHAHDGTAAPAVPVTNHRTMPLFGGNRWDAWKGLDLDGDGYGDTPYRFDRQGAVRAATQPWAGLFLGSPWSLVSQGLPGGEVLDPRPLAGR